MIHEISQGRLYPHIDLYIYLKVELINKTTFSVLLNFTLKEGDMRVCDVVVLTLFSMRYCGEEQLVSRCCGDLKAYGVRCL